jgi:hypothetical protein
MLTVLLRRSALPFVALSLAFLTVRVPGALAEPGADNDDRRPVDETAGPNVNNDIPTIPLGRNLLFGFEVGAEAWYDERQQTQNAFEPGDAEMTFLGRFRGGEAHVVLKFADEDEVAQRNLLEEGYVRLGGGRHPFFAEVGRMEIPVGEGNTHFSTDSAPEMLGETTEKDGVDLGYANGWMYLKAAAYSDQVGPEAEKVDSDEERTIQHVKETAYYASFSPVDAVGFGGYWTSDLSESDRLGGIITTLVSDAFDNDDPLVSPDEVEAWGAFVSCQASQVTFDAEFLGALGDYRAGLLDSRSAGRLSPWGWYGELGWEADTWEAAARYEESHDDPNLPKRQWGVYADRDLDEHVSFSLEYLRGEYRKGVWHQDRVVAEINVEY